MQAATVYDKLDLMSQREQLIEKLVTAMHLSVPERISFSSKTVRHSEVAAVVARVLRDTGSFPANVKPWRKGDVVHEGNTLQKLSDARIRLTLQRGHPIAPQLLASKNESDFEDARSAIEAFIKSEWPNGIDGIAIEAE